MSRKNTETKDAATPPDPLDILAARADLLEPDEPLLEADGMAQSGQAVDTTEKDLLDAMKVARAAARPAIWWLADQQFNDLWGDHTLQGMASPLAEIFRRHGWKFGEMMGRYGPYIALGAAALPPVMATVQAYKIATAPQPVQAEEKGDATAKTA